MTTDMESSRTTSSYNFVPTPPTRKKRMKSVKELLYKYYIFECYDIDINFKLLVSMIACNKTKATLYYMHHKQESFLNFR